MSSLLDGISIIVIGPSASSGPESTLDKDGACKTSSKTPRWGGEGLLRMHLAGMVLLGKINSYHQVSEPAKVKIGISTRLSTSLAVF